MIYVLHHSDTDGYGAAYAAWKKFGDAAKYIPVNYGMAFPVDGLSREDEVFVLDFSFSADVLDAVASQCRLVVIDHHKTAAEMLTGKPYFIYDVSKSGCVLAWEHFHDDACPNVLKYVQDWDLWRFQYMETKAIHTYLETHKDDFAAWDYAAGNVDEILCDGRAMLQFNNHAVKCISEKSWRGDFGGHHAVFVNVPYPFISDTLNYLLEKNSDAAVAVGTSRDKDSESFSLRSRKGGPDVGAIAKTMGGGGHANSAGFRRPIGETK